MKKRVLLGLVLFMPLFAAQAINYESERSKEILRRIAEASIGSYNITVDDRQGDVVLTGSVTSEGARRLVEETARGVKGVKSVESYVKIEALHEEVAPVKVAKRPPTDSEVLARVMGSLKREPDISLGGIGVSVQGGIVHFTGALDRILSNALMVEGVRDIRSELRVAGENYRR